MITTRCKSRPELPVGKIVAVGRNYAAHAFEMAAPRPAEPILFLKPSTSILLEPPTLRLPAWSREVHHEVELVVRVARRLCDASIETAREAVDAAAVGLDLTARDHQATAKEHGLPWAVAKGFDGSAPLSRFFAVTDLVELADLELALVVNGAARQCARTSEMLWSVPELLAFASSRFTLEPGDLVFTGTPAGVGPLAPGDRLVATLGDRARLETRVT